MRHPRDPLEVPVGDTDHLCWHVANGMTELDNGVCCWLDPDETWWRIDMVDGVAVTWCNGVRQEIPF